MSAQLETARLEAQAGILAKFGKAFEQAQQDLERRVADPALRKMAAACWRSLKTDPPARVAIAQN